jgi:hypothetical protein
MMNRAVLIMIVLTLLVSGCSLLNGERQEEPVARVFELYLYPSDISDAIPEGSSVQDSIILAKRFIDTWVKDQLLVHRAEQELTEDQKDFKKQMEEYYRSLLMYTYRQKLLQQKMDTVVSEEEINAYYQDNRSNFILSEDVIKGTFIKVSLSAPQINELRQWSRSNTEESLDQMEKYSLSYAVKFSDFNTHWEYFSGFSAQLPMTISQPSRYLRYNRNIETSDDAYRYFLHVTDHLPEGEVAPLDMVSDDIINILLNKRKIEFFQDLEQIVYQDGVSRNQFEIYE